MTALTGASHGSQSTNSVSARDWIEVVSASFLALSFLIRLAVTWRRPFVQDDFFWAYISWLRSGPGVPNKDYYLPNFTPIAEIAAPLFRMFPESFVPMDIGRGFFFVVGVVLVYACYQLARSLGASVGWSLAAANVLSWQHHFVQRIADIRSDQMMSICLVASIIVLHRYGSQKAGRSGLLFGAAIAISYKIGVVGPWLLALVIVSAGREWLRASVRFSLACLVAPVLYFGLRLYLDGWTTFISVWRDVFGAIGSGSTERFGVFANSFMVGPLSWMFIVIGSIGLAHGVAGDPLTTRRRQVYTLFVIAFTATYVAANPFIFPYNFVVLMPLFAVTVVGVPDAIRAASPTGKLLRPLLLLVPLAAVFSGAPATVHSIRFTNASQVNVMRWLWDSTDKTDAAYDWQGVHLFRPGIFHWWHFSGLQKKYESGWYSVESEIRDRQVKTIFANYRLLGLHGRDRDFVQNNFVEVDTCILVPGWSFTADQIRRGTTFDAFLTNEIYRAQGPSFNGILIDDKPVRHLQRIKAGPHRLSSLPGAPVPPGLTLFYTTQRREQSAPPCMGRGVITWYL